MNEYELERVQDYLGEIAVGDLVIYAKNGDFSNLGSYKKDIWEVISVNVRGDKSTEIKNISKSDSSFKTFAKNLLDVDILSAVDDNWTNYISSRSMIVYNRRQGNKTYTADTPYAASARDLRENEKLERKYNNQTGEVKMNVVNKVIDNNVSAARAGAVISAGNTINKVVKKAVRGQVPRKYRRVIDSPFGDVLVANIASVAVQMGASTNYKAKVATEAMMQASMVEFMNSFNLDQMITDVLDQVNIKDLMPDA